MAFQSMLSGAECSTSSNPLAQFMKHTEGDRSLQQDRVQGGSGGPSGAGLRHLPSGGMQMGNGGSGGAAEAEAFFRQQQGGGGQPGAANATPFDFEAMRREMENLRARGGGGGGGVGASGPGWAEEMARQAAGGRGPPPPELMRQMMAGGGGGGGGPSMAEMEAAFGRNGGPNGAEALAWRSQFSNDQADHFAGGASSDNGQAGVSQPAFSRPMMGMMGGGMGMGVGMMNSGYGMGQYGGFRPAMSSSAAQGSQTALDKGKSRFVELDDATWEEQFKRIDAEAESKGKGKGKAPEGDHALPSEEEQNAAIRNALEDLERDVADDGRESNNRFEELWNAMNKDHATGVPPSAADADLAQWEEELMRSRGGYSHPGGGLGAGDTGLNETAGFDGTEDALRELDGFGTVTADGYPRLGTYRFSEQNAFRDHPNPLAEGLRLMGNGGSLSDAALLFEVAAQREIVGPTGGEQGEVDRSRRERSEAWRRLGECQAMNERETQAIRALEEAVRIDEGNLEAYMALAISYTNEGYDAAAHSTLERYMSRAYPHLKPSALPPSLQGNGDPLEGTGTHNPWAQLNRVTDLFLSAARQGASSGTIDPEVQVGLGVLYYSSAAYDQARDCFATALHARPNDFLLWNRLGATLANGGKPEEAIEAYHKALELRPTFTRAIYNLSVSCLNLGAHHEAAEHLLAALSLQQTQSMPDAPEGEVPPPPPLAQAQESHNLWSTLRRIFLCMDRMDLAQRAVVGADLQQFRGEGFEF